MTARSLVALAAVLVTAVLVRDAGACSCVGPDVHLASPNREDDAPLNTRVRLIVPIGTKSRFVLRPVGTNLEVQVNTRRAPNGSIELLELEPTSRLAPRTRYEVATVDETLHPPVHVFGTFQTGTDADTTAPKLESLKTVSVRRGTALGSCGTPGPWIGIDELRASDPGRPGAQLGLAYWVADATGRIDDTKPPVGIERLDKGRLSYTLGNASVCDPRSFPFPKGGGSFGLGLAIVDEAGNRSPTRRLAVSP